MLCKSIIRYYSAKSKPINWRNGRRKGMPVQQSDKAYRQMIGMIDRDSFNKSTFVSGLVKKIDETAKEPGMNLEKALESFQPVFLSICIAVRQKHMQHPRTCRDVTKALYESDIPHLAAAFKLIAISYFKKQHSNGPATTVETLRAIIAWEPFEEALYERMIERIRTRRWRVTFDSFDFWDKLNKIAEQIQSASVEGESTNNLMAKKYRAIWKAVDEMFGKYPVICQRIIHCLVDAKPKYHDKAAMRDYFTDEENSDEKHNDVNEIYRYKQSRRSRLWEWYLRQWYRYISKEKEVKKGRVSTSVLPDIEPADPYSNI